jgi:nicotinamide mononucleotide transporter
MMELIRQGLDGLLQQSLAEWIAVALSLAYLILLMRQNILAWPCAFLSTAIFTWVFWDASLLMESGLNIYYMAMAVYGWWHWLYGKKADQTELPIQTWPWHFHAIAISSILFASGVSGYLLEKNTNAALPYLDSFTTWGAVFTTFLVARKIFENWLYWLVIDSAALYLYIQRGLAPTALLMMLYLVLVVVGIFTWRKAMRAQHAG